ncbi:MAG: VWA domain-containing protein [Planctomycetes bacterium]|nr:VWA domain-containing protein [Planctomycetota bacterium]
MKSLALLGLAFALFHFGAPAHLVADADPKSAYAEFDRLLPLAKSDVEADIAKVRAALAEGKSGWLTIAAVEAVRQAEVDAPGKGKRFLVEVLALLEEKHQKLHEQQIVTVNVLACLGVLVAKGDPEVSDVVKAIVGWQRWSKNTGARLRDMADRVLLKLTGEDCTLKDETLAFWDWWLAQQAVPGGNRPPAQSRTAPVIFKEPMVGTRIVFVIDVSDSMKYPISKPDLPKMRERAPDLPWDKEKKPTAMWVAIEELARSIDALRPAKNPVAPRNARSTKTEVEPRHFAIVTYSSESRLITPGWVEATKDNCDTWMKKARSLETETTTNIHAGLLQAFSISGRSNVTLNPELDVDCVLTGAHTIVFLTDGYATWSNDSRVRDQKDEFGNPTGDGQYVKRDKLAELARYINRFRKVVINTVGIGIHDKVLMAAFAKDSGGAYTDWGCEIDWKK